MPAQGELEPVSLSYHAPEQCPTQAEFLREVRRSTPRLGLADAPPAAGTRRFEVSIADEGSAGTLTIDDGNAGVREARGADCAEVSRLLAFATALAVDPDATQQGDASALATPPATRRAEPPTQAKPTPQPAARAPSKSTLRGSAGVFGNVEWASAPSASYGGGAFGELQLRALPRPLLRLGVGYAKSADVTIHQGGTVSFSDVSALLDLCPVSLESERWSLYPCLRAMGLRTTAAPNGAVPNPQTKHPLLLELGLAGQIRARILGSAFAQLGFGLLLPLERTNVKLKGVTPDVHEVPWIAGFGELSVGVEFR